MSSRGGNHPGKKSGSHDEKFGNHQAAKPSGKASNQKSSHQAPVYTPAPPKIVTAKDFEKLIPECLQSIKSLEEKIDSRGSTALLEQQVGHSYMRLVENAANAN